MIALTVSVDSKASARTEAADLWQRVEQGLLTWDDVVALQDVVSGTHQGRLHHDDVIVSKPTGWGLGRGGGSRPARAGGIVLRAGPSTRRVVGFANGSRELHDLLGCEGANVAEMTQVLRTDNLSPDR